MGIVLYANDNEAAESAIAKSDTVGAGNPTISTASYPELDENGERTGNTIRTATITFADEWGLLTSETVMLDDLKAAVDHAYASETPLDYGIVQNGTHVPGPRPGPPKPGDTPPPLPDEPPPPLNAA